VISCGPGEKVSSSASLSSSLQVIKKDGLETSQEDVEHITTTKPTNTISPEGWKLTFEDNFDIKEVAISKGADPACFSRKPVCKAWPHFRINPSNCDGSVWSGYCIWPEDGWWRARLIND
jgi:hypothetical protein